MKYLLIRPKYFATVASVEPLGLEYIAAVLKQEGKEYEIHDEFVYSYFFRFARIKNIIKKHNYDIVCFSTTANKAHYILKVAKKLKHCFPHIKILLGGAEVSINYKDFYLENIDFVYYDHGLESFRGLVQNDFDLKTLSQSKGVAYKTIDGDTVNWVQNEQGAPINDYNFEPDRSFFYKHKRKYYIIGKGRFALLRTSFSCPEACVFCVSRLLNGASYQERKIDNVINEISNINGDKIWIIDDDFLANSERALTIANELVKRGIKKTFMIFARADSIIKNADHLAFLRKAGFRDMLVGLEAVDNKFLNEYNKNSSTEINERAVDLLNEHKIVCNALFVTSLDFEAKNFEEIHRFIKRKKLIWSLFSILTPYKGSSLYEENKDHLYKFEYERLGGTRIILEPKKLSHFAYYFHFNMLYVRRYPKLYWATLTRKYDRLVADNEVF